MFLGNEESRRKAEENYRPFLYKVYRHFNKDIEESEDQTVPFPKKIYDIVYVRSFTMEENVLIAEIIEKYVKSNTNLDLAFTEIRNMRQLGPFKRKLFASMQDNQKTTGTTPAEAIKEVAGELIDPKLVKALEIGHKSNRMQDMLNNYIGDARYAMANQNKMKKALMYPITVLTLISAICVAGKFLLLPAFMPASFDGEVVAIPSQFKSMVTVADLFLKPYRLAVLVVIGKAIQIAFKKSVSLKAIQHFALLQLPVISNYLVTKDICGFFIHLHSEIDAAIPTQEAHIDSCKSLENSVLRDVFEDKTDLMSEGVSISEAYSSITYLDEDVKILLKISEENGSLPEALATCTAILKDKYQSITETVIEMMPTLSMLVAGTAIFILFIPILLGMYEIEGMLN